MRRYTLHIVLFVLTVGSTWFIGWHLTKSWIEGGFYSVSIILILLGHEMAHYFMSQKYNIRATLPFFLPLPLPPFGTLGAVIRMESTIPSRKALFDTGIAGPLASLLLSIPAIAIGLKLSKLIHVSQIKNGFTFSNPPLFYFIQKSVLGQIPMDHILVVHPLGYAGWVGLFVTSLNLLPIGQLDGGHIAYALFGRRSRAIFLITIAVMAFITIFYNPGWLLLVILFIIFGFRHPSPLDDQTPLDGKRKLLGGIAFLAFLLSFNPAPFPEFIEEIRQALHWF